MVSNSFIMLSCLPLSSVPKGTMKQTWSSRREFALVFFLQLPLFHYFKLTSQNVLVSQNTPSALKFLFCLSFLIKLAILNFILKIKIKQHLRGRVLHFSFFEWIVVLSINIAEPFWCFQISLLWWCYSNLVPKHLQYKMVLI